MSRKSRFVTVVDGKYCGVYEVGDTKFAIPPEDGQIICPCCQERMEPCFDVQQMGFWQDVFQTYMVCISCKKAIVFHYELSRIDIRPRRSRPKVSRKHNAG